MAEAADERVVFEVAERGGFIVPGPLVSRGRPLFDARGPLPRSPSTGSLDWRAGPVAEGAGDAQRAEPWLAMQAGVGPVRLLVSWAAPPQASGSSLPTRYRIETSANSRQGSDGDWRLEQHVVQVGVAARAHVIEFDGQSWVRLTFEEAPAELALARFELHDASDGTDDAWLILGDEFASWGLVPSAGEPSLADLVCERYPGYHPALIDETRLGESPARTLERLDELAALHPHARRVGLGYAGGGLATPAALEALVVALLARGYVPVIAQAPCGEGLAAERALELNRAITALEARYRLVPGPDASGAPDRGSLSATGSGQPSAEARRVLQRLWLEALDVLYVPQ